ncbi:MAG: hypothetical protein E6I01_10995, partial [Chloroflexi bacterium]
GTYLLILTGSLVVGSGASGACDAWPLCGGGFRLAVEGSPAIQLLHRGVAAVIGLLVVMSLLSVLARHRRQPAVRATVALTLAALAFQVAVGAAVVTLSGGCGLVRNHRSGADHSPAEPPPCPPPEGEGNSARSTARAGGRARLHKPGQTPHHPAAADHRSRRDDDGGARLAVDRACAAHAAGGRAGGRRCRGHQLLDRSRP